MKTLIIEKRMRKNKLTEWLLRKSRLIFHRYNYEVIWQLKLRNWSVAVLCVVLVGFAFGVSYAIIAYTPIESTLPNFPTTAEKRLIQENFFRTDSLLKEVEKRDKYLKMMQDFIYDEIPIDQKYIVNPIHLSDKQMEDFNDPTIKRKETHIPTVNLKKDDIQNLYVPLKGVIINHFNPNNEHFGIDIAASGSENVSATLSGTVLLADYTVKYGYTIIIQHNNDLISIYKHCAKILVVQCQFVTAGQVIAIYGTSGEESSGQHLHFELWKKGYVINPEEFINF